jgi:tetratricopeptide (TPR) repeat protein
MNMSPGDARRARCVAVCVALIVLGSCASPGRPPSDVDARIDFYVKKLSEHPRLFAVYTQLGAAYLEKARETHDPAFLARGRDAVKHSVAIQPNFPAFKVMAGLCNFAHQFECALEWGRRAAVANPADRAVTALLVEAYMGLGRYEDAAKLLPSPEAKAGDFYTAAALGQWLASQLRYDEAVGAFLGAANFARATGASDLTAWAEVRAAGALLDWGRPGPARSHLEAAASLGPLNRVVWKDLRLHWAEFYEAEGQLDKALAEYESLLAEQEDPAIRHRAFLVARWLGQEDRAHKHFEAAAQGFQRVIDAGEIYTLGGLARLYADGNVNMEHALALAQHNLEYKRDIEAEATLAYVQSKLWLPARPRMSRPGGKEAR